MNIPRTALAATGLTVRVVPGDLVEEPDLRKAASLLELAFHPWPSIDPGVPALEHLRWKISGLAGRPGGLTLVEDGDLLVGLNLNLYTEVLLEGFRRSVVIGADTCIHPDYQGRGIYSARRRFGVEVVDPPNAFNFSFSLEPRTTGVESRSGGLHLGNDLRTRFKFYDARTLATDGRRPAAALRTFAAIEGARAWNRFRHPPHLRGAAWHGEVRGVQRFDERLDAFFERAAASFAFIAVRDQAYLNWRYCDPRGGRYSAVIAEEGDEVAGYAVTRVARRPDEHKPRGYLLDLLTLPARADVARALAESALRRMRAEGVSAVSCWSPSRHPYNHSLGRLGFVDARRPSGLSYRKSGLLDAELDVLASEEAPVHLTIGDADWV